MWFLVGLGTVGFDVFFFSDPLHAVVGLSDLLLQASADKSIIVPGSRLDLTSPDHKRTLLHPELVDNLRYISEGARLMQAIVNDGTYLTPTLV